MKITKQQLKKIIKEELSMVLRESDDLDALKAEAEKLEGWEDDLYRKGEMPTREKIKDITGGRFETPEQLRNYSTDISKKIEQLGGKLGSTYAHAPDPPDPDKPIRTSYSAKEIFGLSEEPNR